MDDGARGALRGADRSLALHAAARGLPVILDLGFTQAEYRARLASLARSARFSAQLHVLESAAETRWA
ncbi:AAA family ATPase [Pseudoroseomonas globiformis]|uniref:AAA family ATPase n=1 Tax=Teichococcus globiformis TaxID=2307229 RepID=A0ABV7FSW2_9PROT